MVDLIHSTFMCFIANDRRILPMSALTVVCLCVVGGSVTAALAAANLVSNGGFEGSGAGSLSGWGGSSGSLALVAGNGGGHAAQLTASAGASSTYAYTVSKPVTSAVAGAAYQLSGDIQSSIAGQSVCLVVKELKAGGTTSVGSSQSCLTATSAWQSVPTVSYTVKTSGDSLTVNVAEKPAVAGARFAFDNIALTAGASGPPDTQAPTVPQNVSATANSATSVTVSWTASTDAGGVAGYDVFRGTTRVATVGGSTTAWTDTTVQADTTYSYSVDAFDAVPNTSPQSTVATVSTPPGSGGGGGGGGGPAAPVIVIVMENKHYSDIVGSSSAPYIQSLIARGTLYTKYQAGPGSLPDYLAMTSGLTGSTSGSNNIFNQLQAKGVSWGEYEESMPKSCYTGGDVTPYKKAHNPAVYYNDITSSAGACANVVPYTSFDPGHLRAFSYVVPNLNHDMHDGASRTAQIQAGDAWLAANVPAMLNAGAEVILTWDEGSISDEHIATIAVGATVAVGATDSHAYTHPGLLAGLEDAWGLPRLNAAQTANPFPIH
jgi:phosphoesterase family protein/fibronectin type III domain protein